MEVVNKFIGINLFLGGSKRRNLLIYKGVDPFNSRAKGYLTSEISLKNFLFFKKKVVYMYVFGVGMVVVFGCLVVKMWCCV